MRQEKGSVYLQENYLKSKEWSTGNGQCPECCGVPPSWYGHPLHRTTDSIGHEPSCKLAGAISEAGGSVLFVGSYQAEDFAPSYREDTVRGQAAKELFDLK